MAEGPAKDETSPAPIVEALDKDMQALQEGDRVRFVMRGFYLPREQESFGKILTIDRWGGITIEVAGTYRHFVSSGAVASYSRKVYFCHHRYDRERRARVYFIEAGKHSLFLSKFEGAENVHRE